MDKKHIMIGSMLWVTLNEPREEIEKDVRGMMENRLEIARLFMNPGTVKRPDGTYDFTVWDDVFSLSEKYGLKLTPTLSSLTVPKGTAEDYQKEREALKACNKEIVARYAASPALHSWILQNEPNVSVVPNAVTLPLFRRWLLEEQYGWDLEALRIRYDRSVIFGSYFTAEKKKPSEAEKEKLRKDYAPLAEKIGSIHPDGTGELPSGYPQRVDWGNFNAYILNNQLKEMGDLVHETDPAHPTTINPDNISQAYPGEGGRNLYEEGRTVDFLGCSCHPAWHSTRFQPERIAHSVGMFADMTRSATADPDGYFWITELQAGTNFFSGSRPLCPSAGDITRWLWTAIGTGCRGMIYWLYKARPAGFEGLEWALMNQRGEPSRRSRASAKVAEAIKANEDLFESTRPAKNDVYILHSFDSINLASVETNPAQGRSSDLDDPRNAKMVQDALCGAYLMAADNGWQAGFVWEYDLDKLPENGVLLAPNTYALSTEVLKKLSKWVENGGTLVADGLFGAKTPQGYRSPKASDEALSRMIGHPADDWMVDIAPFDFEKADGGKLPGWYLTVNWENEEGLEVLARDEDGYASIVRRQSGKGQVLMIGTLFFHAYFAGKSGEESRKFLKDQLKIEKTYMLSDANESLTLRVLEGGTHDVLVLINHGAACDAALCVPKGRYKDILTDESFEDPARLPMGKGQVRVLKIKR